MASHRVFLFKAHEALAAELFPESPQVAVFL
jgi:hypothetical protein